MLKSLSNFFKSDMAKYVFVAIVVAIVGYSLMNYSSAKGLVSETLVGSSVSPNEESTLIAGVQGAKPAQLDETPSTCVPC